MTDHEFIRIKRKIEWLREQQRACGDADKNALLGRMIGEYADKLLVFIRGDD